MAGSGRRRLFTDQQLIELHEQGFNDVEIGKKLGVDRKTVNGQEGDSASRLMVINDHSPTSS